MSDIKATRRLVCTPSVIPGPEMATRATTPLDSSIAQRLHYFLYQYLIQLAR